MRSDTNRVSPYAALYHQSRLLLFRAARDSLSTRSSPPSETLRAKKSKQARWRKRPKLLIRIELRTPTQNQTPQPTRERVYDLQRYSPSVPKSGRPTAHGQPMPEARPNVFSHGGVFAAGETITYPVFLVLILTLLLF